MVYGRLMTTRQLGHTNIYLSPIGLGTAQFAGKGWISALTPTIPQAHVDTIIKTAPNGGITWFDSSEMYGGGTSGRAQMRAMARLVQAGTIRAVGASNFTTRQMEIAHGELAKHGIPLASNEVQIDLLHRSGSLQIVPEERGQLVERDEVDTIVEIHVAGARNDH